MQFGVFPFFCKSSKEEAGSVVWDLYPPFLGKHLLSKGGRTSLFGLLFSENHAKGNSRRLSLYLSDDCAGASEALFRKKDDLSPSGGNGDFRLPDYLGAQPGLWRKILRCCIFRAGAHQLNGASCGYRVLPHDSFVDSAHHYLLSDRSAENAGKDLEETAKLVLSFLPAFVSAHFLYLSGSADSRKGRVFLHPDALQLPFRILRILADSAV